MLIMGAEGRRSGTLDPLKFEEKVTISLLPQGGKKTYEKKKCNGIFT